jgi:hypothetical protein
MVLVRACCQAFMASITMWPITQGSYTCWYVLCGTYVITHVYGCECVVGKPGMLMYYMYRATPENLRIWLWTMDASRGSHLVPFIYFTI